MRESLRSVHYARSRLQLVYYAGVGNVLRLA